MMRHLVRSLEDIPLFENTAVTVGSFDGVHVGHRTILERLRVSARARGLSSIAITFEPHHRIYFGREPRPFLLTDLDEKLALLGETSVEHTLVLPFDGLLAGLSAREFLERVLIDRLGAKLFLVGHDQAIGRDQVRGPKNVARSAKGLDLDLETVPPIDAGGAPVSSTRIRTALTDGETTVALALLGNPYLLTGKVVHGDERGRQLGYPTANIALDEPYKLIPAPGVYIATADVLDTPTGDAQVRAMLYLGTRPTFDDSRTVVELFLMDWTGDLYDTRLRVSIYARIRGDMRFDGASELVERMRRDEEITRTWFDERERCMMKLSM